MSRSTLILAGCLALFCTSLAAEEFELEFAKAVHNPVAFFGSAPVEDVEGESGWLEGGAFLSDEAKTVIVHLSLGGSGFNALLVSVDRSAAGAKHPETLHIDLDGDRKLGEGETFPLAVVDNEGAGPVMPFTVLCAEKMAYLEKDETTLVNFYYPIMDDAPPGFGIAFGISAWGCYTGKITLGNVVYDATLEDRTVNGAFDDFDKGDRFDCDSLSLHRTDQSKPVTGMTQPSPLRRKMLVGGQAYGVAVKDNGKVLALDPIAIETSTVSAGAPDLAVNLSHPDWGSLRIEPGESKAFPTGEWTIDSYSREKADPQCVCHYSAPAEKTVTVKNGEAVSLDLATALEAVITAQRQQGMIRLDLAMTTAGGARFRGYYSAASGGTGGIPFHITDAAGETVEKGTFEFG